LSHLAFAVLTPALERLICEESARGVGMGHNRFGVCDTQNRGRRQSPSKSSIAELGVLVHAPAFDRARLEKSTRVIRSEGNLTSWSAGCDASEQGHGRRRIGAELSVVPVSDAIDRSVLIDCTGMAVAGSEAADATRGKAVESRGAEKSRARARRGSVARGAILTPTP
jgi:hypothetical protein